MEPDDVLCLQVKLEEALALATDFHNSLQDFINWLTTAEQTLHMVSPASLILDTIMFQIDEHKVMFVRRRSLMTNNCFVLFVTVVSYVEAV